MTDSLKVESMYVEGNHLKRFDKIVFYVAAIIPWGFAISIIAFYVHASILLGRFPTYANPDPKDLSIYSFYGYIINLFLVTWFLSFLIWLIAFIVFLAKNKIVEYKKQLLPVFLGHLVCIAIFISRIFNWYID